MPERYLTCCVVSGTFRLAAPSAKPVSLKHDA
jgi:hypothetical protein